MEHELAFDVEDSEGAANYAIDRVLLADLVLAPMRRRHPAGHMTNATTRRSLGKTPVEENAMSFPAVSFTRFAGLILCSVLLCVAGCTDMTSRPAVVAGDRQPAPFCTGEAAQHCGYCVSDCSDSACTLNRDRCDPRGVPLGLESATLYRRCASECSYKVNGLQVPAAEAANAAPAQPPCICQQPRPIPGAF
jgi:hypothetical protein